MAIERLSVADYELYNHWVRSHPDGTLWQSLEWRDYQKALGREVNIYVHKDKENILSSALVVVDRTVGGFCTWDIPRGPLVNDKYQIASNKGDCTDLLQYIVNESKKDKCMSIFLSPGKPIANCQLPIATSQRHEQPEATRLIDISLSEEEILAQMKQKGRYNIHVAEKNGVNITESKDIVEFSRISDKTGKRDGFRNPSTKTYNTFLKHLEGSFLLLAHHPNNQSPIAGLIGVTWNNRAYYYYGASDYNYRQYMAPYLLQWEAMKKAKQAGCTQYDLFGIAPAESENHPWKGVTAFKEKFGGMYREFPAEQQMLLRPWVSRVIEWKRKLIG